MLVAMMYGPQAAFVAEMFSTEVRYSGASLGYQLGAILGGGFAPIIATALLAEYQDTVGISIYMAIACAITLVVDVVARRDGGRAGRDVDGEPDDHCVANVPSIVFQESLLPLPEKMSVNSRPPLRNHFGAKFHWNTVRSICGKNRAWWNTCHGPHGLRRLGHRQQRLRGRVAGAGAVLVRVHHAIAAPARTSSAGTDRRRPDPRRSRAGPRDRSTTSVRRVLSRPA